MPHSPVPESAAPGSPVPDSVVLDSSARGTGARPRRRRGRIAAAAIALALAVGAIGTGAYALTRPGDADGAHAAIGVILEPTSLDVRHTPGVAAGQILIDNVVQGLVGIRQGSVSEVVPVLATELPEVSADGREYTFVLRTGVTFHSGAPLTVDDAVASLHDALGSAEPGRAAVEVAGLDARTVRLTLAEPDREFLRELAGPAGLIVPASRAAERDRGVRVDSPEFAVDGTGPYAFTSWERGERLTLTRNADYWGEAGTLATVDFRFLPQGRAAVQALKSGEVDVHTALLPSLREEFAESPDFALERATGPDVFTLAFNSAKAPLDDPRVRAALSRAVDPAAIIASQHGDGAPLGGPITPGEPGYADLTDVNAYDPDSARQLLSEAGQEHLNLTLTVPDHYDTAPLDLLKGQFSAVGVALTVRRVEFPVWLEQVYTNHDYQLSYVDHAETDALANYGDPESYFGYDSPFVRDRLAAASTAPDAASAAQLRAEAAERVAADAPAKWLFTYTPTNVVGRHVGGFPSANTNARINLAGVTVDARS